MSIIDHTDPAHGELTRQGNNFAYLPDANFVGVDSFTYRAQRGSSEPQTGTVAIDVTGRVTSVESRDDTSQTDEDIPDDHIRARERRFRAGWGCRSP